MTANLIALAVGIVGVLFIGIANWWKSGQDRSIGAALEAGKVNAASAKAEAAMAQAAVEAPTTEADALSRLDGGTG